MKLGKQSKVECRSIREQLLSEAKSCPVSYKDEADYSLTGWRGW
jgi:hypothetical protein